MADKGPPQRSKVAPWLCPTVPEPRLWMVSLALRRDTIQSVRSSTVGQPGRHHTHSFGGAFGAHWASSRALWSAPEALLGTPSTLVERPRCNFGVILTLWLSLLFQRSREGGAMYNPYMQAHVSEGFAKSSKTHF